MNIQMEPRSKAEVAKKSATKTILTSLVVALSVAVLGGAAEFFTQTDVLSSILGADTKLLILVPIFGMLGNWLKDYLKHI